MLDDFIHENSIEQVDLLKLDLQGSELPALTGASEARQEEKIKYIHCEIMSNLTTNMTRPPVRSFTNSWKTMTILCSTSTNPTTITVICVKQTLCSFTLPSIRLLEKKRT